METNGLLVDKSEILFLYESSYSVPNGDPFTSEQRYDEETKKVLVSDVRIKRFIRDHFDERGRDVYVIDKRRGIEGEKGAGAALRMLALKDQFKDDESVMSEVKGKKKPDAIKILQKCIDVRLFGGISTEEKDAVNLTGAVQFALLNPSLNKVDLRMHQNTSVFVSSEEKTRGAIGTTTVVPYSLNQIHGWINPYSAKHTGLKQDDITEMFKALWASINNANTRSKSNQNSLLLLQIVYADANKKLYGIDRLIKLTAEKQEEQIRSSEDYTLDFSKLKETVAQSSAVKQVNFYTESPDVRQELEGADKFNPMELL
ncbi:MAG: CRISPR-associated protein Csh2 [Acidobacteriota bacterium]|jgi:CRISPR-associated protein Csh2|nr:CRISPR-associated protein Csh2 [Acidobacteriota bacterium]